MDTSTFIDRIVEILRYVNSQAVAGEGAIMLTQDQFDIINETPDIESASKYLLSYGVPQHLLAMALDEDSDIGSMGNYDVSMSQAQSQYGLVQPGESPIGVPANYVSPRGDEATEYYTENELISLFTGKDEEEIARIQAGLINAGLLEPDASFIAGDWGRTTQTAFSFVLDRVNRRGVTAEEKITGTEWNAALDEYVNNPLPKYPDAPAYLPPDYDTVKNSIVTMFRRRVNRKPQPYELKLLANTLYSEAQQAYTQDTELTEMTRQEDVTGSGLLAGEFGNYSKENVQSSIDTYGMTQIDQSASLANSFDNLIVKEEERMGENLDIRKARSSMFASLNQRPGAEGYF